MQTKSTGGQVTAVESEARKQLLMPAVLTGHSCTGRQQWAGETLPDGGVLGGAQERGAS